MISRSGKVLGDIAIVTIILVAMITGTRYIVISSEAQTLTSCKQVYSECHKKPKKKTPTIVYRNRQVCSYWCPTGWAYTPNPNATPAPTVWKLP